MKLSLQLVATCACIGLGLSRVDANHVHMQVAWRGDALTLEVYDFETGSFPSDAFPFVVNNAGINLVPSASSFDFLGEAGSTFFALPQEDDPELPFLGIGVDAIPNGTFVGNRIRLRLVSVDGPGRFALYEVNSFGQPSLRMNSADGIDADDVVDLALGAHEHVNWAFNGPGEYRLVFIAEGARQSDGESISSAPATYRFRVLPPPGAQLVLEYGAIGSEPKLLVKSRVGARLQLLEAVELGQWTLNSTRLLSESEWNITPEPSDAGRRFWQIQEVFE